MVDIRLLTTEPAGDWRRAVEIAGSSRLAHAAEWFAIVARAYGHTPLYLAADAGPGEGGVLPAFLVRRPLVGSVVTSMPYLDSGGPCSAPSTSARIDILLVDRLINEARQRGARLVELRCSRSLAIDARPLETKVNLSLALPANADLLWRGFAKGVRNQIRKAERSGLTVERGDAASLPAFYETFVERMRDLGSPVHALEFLRQVVGRFGARARVMLVKKGALTVGGLVALASGDRLVVPWATCLKDHFALCPNMLLYWETIRSACGEGFARFDFGRSTRHSGTYHFKRQWGADEEPLYWYRIPLAARPSRHAGESTPGRALIAGMWRRLPLPVTRHLGPHIRKYLIQ